MVRTSIVVPCYNVADQVGSTLQSIRGQTLDDWEAILVNDGSTDDTAECLRRFAADEPRACIIEQPNAGLSAARNAGLAKAAGDSVLFLDAGDILLPQSLAVLGGLLDGHSKAGAACGGWRFIGPNGEDEDWLGWSPKGVLAFDDFVTRNPVNTDSLLIRREWFARVGGFDVTLPACEDWDLWMRLAHAGCMFVTTPEPVSCYRMSPGSMSRRAGLMLDAGLRVLRKAAECRRARGAGADLAADAEADWWAYCLACAFAQGGEVAARPLLSGRLEKLKSDRLEAGVTREENHGLEARATGGLRPRVLAQQLYFAVPYVACTFPGRWPSIWPEIKPDVKSWLALLERSGTAFGLAHDCLSHLDQLIGNTEIVDRLSRCVQLASASKQVIVYGQGRNGQELLRRLNGVGIHPSVADDADGAGSIGRFLGHLDEQLIVVTPWENEKMCRRLTLAGARHRTHFVRWNDFADPIGVNAID